MTKTNTVDVKVLPTGCWRIGATHNRVFTRFQQVLESLRSTRVLTVWRIWDLPLKSAHPDPLGFSRSSWMRSS